MNEECTPEETEARLEVCKTCDSFSIEEDYTTKCQECMCSISLMITFKDQPCPKGNW